jgi:uncharacterized protein YxjI
MFVVFAVLSFAVIHLDLLANGNWLISASVSRRWYNYLTSHHALTVLYLHSSYLWLLPNAILAIIVGLLIVFDLDGTITKAPK